jgi:uncharacterized protein YdiU (UPF0061 family)
MEQLKKDVFQLMTEEEENYVKTREENGFVSIGLKVSYIMFGTFEYMYYLYKNVPLNELTEQNIEALNSNHDTYKDFTDKFLNKYEKYDCGKEAYKLCKYRIHSVAENCRFSN